MTIPPAASPPAELLSSPVGYVAPARHRPAAHRIQTRLQQRRPTVVRRHASRTLKRLAVVVLGDLLALATALVVFAATAESLIFGAPFSRMLSQMVGIGTQAGGFFAAATLLALVVTGSYGRPTVWRQQAHLLKASALATTVACWSALVVSSIGALILPWAWTVLVTWLFLLAGRQGTNWLMNRQWTGPRGTIRALLVGTHDEYEAWCARGLAPADEDYSFLGYVSTHFRNSNSALGTLDDLAEVIDGAGVESVVVGGYLPDHQLSTVVDISLTAGCELLYPARAVTLVGVRPRLVWRQGEPYFELGAPVLRAQELLAKRVVDLIGAVLGLVLLAPVFLAIAAAVRLDSPGPVFFSQFRAGLGGRRFSMLKFRTMRVGADDEKNGLAHLNHSGDARLFKIPNDPRITRLGAWLRRWSLDELPQLWNVLVGDMSLVGPRPFFETDLEDYEAHHFRRLGAKPGITGLWQVKGRSSLVDFEEVVRLDRDYIERWSMFLDLRILLATVPVVLKRTGAY